MSRGRLVHSGSLGFTWARIEVNRNFEVHLGVLRGRRDQFAWFQLGALRGRGVNSCWLGFTQARVGVTSLIPGSLWRAEWSPCILGFAWVHSGAPCVLRVHSGSRGITLACIGVSGFIRVRVG